MELHSFTSLVLLSHLKVPRFTLEFSPVQSPARCATPFKLSALKFEELLPQRTLRFLCVLFINCGYNINRLNIIYHKIVGTVDEILLCLVFYDH